MRECLLDPELTFQVTKKLQRVSYEGVMVTLSGSKVSASMSLYSYYERTSTGVSERQVMGMIESVAREVSKNMPQIDWDVLGNYGQMKETLTLQMIPVKGNEEKLTEILHETVEDMVVVYRSDLDNNERETSSALVTDAMRKSYGITGEQLATDAIDVTVKSHLANLWKRQKSKSRKSLFVRKTS